MLRQEKQDRPLKDAARRVPSPLTSKSFLLAGAALIGAGGLWFSTPEKGSTASWLSTYAPATMTLAGSYLGGFLIGWGARRALRTTAIVAGVAILLLGLLTKFGLGGSAIEPWIQASVGWVSEHLDMAQRYLASLLPSATAAGAGSVMGYRRKRGYYM
jgi:uncharacterized membrane protein (Fun14 family)